MTTLAPSSLMAPKRLADTAPPVASLFRAHRFPRSQHRSQNMDEIPLQDPRGPARVERRRAVSGSRGGWARKHLWVWLMYEAGRRQFSCMMFVVECLECLLRLWSIVLEMT